MLWLVVLVVVFLGVSGCWSGASGVTSVGSRWAAPMELSLCGNTWARFTVRGWWWWLKAEALPRSGVNGGKVGEMVAIRWRNGVFGTDAGRPSVFMFMKLRVTETTVSSSSLMTVVTCGTGFMVEVFGNWICWREENGRKQKSMIRILCLFHLSSRLSSVEWSVVKCLLVVYWWHILRSKMRTGMRKDVTNWMGETWWGQMSPWICANWHCRLCVRTIVVNTYKIRECELASTDMQVELMVYMSRSQSCT